MEDGHPLDTLLDAMRQMGILSTNASASNRAAAAQLELHNPFRLQLRQALAVRDTSPWKEQVWLAEQTMLAARVLFVGRIHYGSDRRQWREAARRTVGRYHQSSCGDGGSCGGRAYCTIW
jgi:hypothetical protein